MATSDKIQKLWRSLYPQDARAFKVPYMGILWRWIRARSLSISRAYDASENILDAMLPDNNNFTAADATRMERFFGMITDSSVPLADRKAALRRKMAHPGQTPARQHYLFIQEQLRAANFDVYVYENRFLLGSPATLQTQTPFEILSFGTEAYYGSMGYGEGCYGEEFEDTGITKIANYLEENRDALFYAYSSSVTGYRSTFFIAGETIDTFAEVPEIRKTEFRELICKLKPTQMCGFLFVNYT